MGIRLLLLGVIAAGLAACEGTGPKGNDQKGQMSTGGRAEAASTAGRDAIERALMDLGVDGRVLRIDVNGGREKRVRVGQAHLTRDLLLLEEEAGGKRRRRETIEPTLLALKRDGLGPLWVADLREPTMFPIAANNDTVVLVSRHYAHALELATGARAIRFMRGTLAGLSQPYLELPFTPTGGAAVGLDTFYVPSLGSPRNNKTIESFSLITGQRGWGYRTSADILTTPVVGGPWSDPKLYLVTRTGHVICMNATNYGYAPRGTRWEALLEDGVDYGLFVTDDSPAHVGSVFLVDRAGVVYCLNRVTGDRRWVHATGREPVGAPMVFGDVCVVPMRDGLSGFDAVNVLYALRAEAGPSEGETYWMRAGEPTTLDNGLTLRVEGEVLVASGKGLTIDGARPQGGRGTLRNGSVVKIGEHVLSVEDRGAAPLWTDLPYDRIVARVADRLIAQKGDALVLLDKWTGEAVGSPVTLPGARLIPANTTSADLFVVGGDAVVYGLFAR